jgi:hypothetical protein
MAKGYGEAVQQWVELPGGWCGCRGVLENDVDPEMILTEVESMGDGQIGTREQVCQEARWRSWTAGWKGLYGL